jgi:cyclic-di-GMP-binding protein
MDFRAQKSYNNETFRSGRPDSPLFVGRKLTASKGGNMASSFSFDVVSDFDRQELVNAIDQVKRDVSTRFDLKDTKTEITLEAEQITINTENEFVLEQVKDVITTRTVKRNLSLKILDFQKAEPAAGGRVRQVIKLKKGISQELAKQISKLVRDSFKNAQSQIQGDAVRVTSKSKDELQGIITLLKAQDYPVALQFTNYR